MKLVYAFKINWLIKQSTGSAQSFLVVKLH